MPGRGGADVGAEPGGSRGRGAGAGEGAGWPAPLAGRRLWFVGIGGAGLSAYALVARAWGAEVAGWDRNDTPYLAPLRAAGVRVEVAPEPVAAPPGWEAVVSSAYTAQAAGRPRGELLAELVAARPSIVVAGAHGKTTTTAMIAFVLRETGRDPAFVVGGIVPQLGGNAAAGHGWLVCEGDESDRSLALLSPRVAVVTNIDLDHHTEFASRAEVEALFDGWLARAVDAIRGWELEPVGFPLAVPGVHNRRNAATALAALELAGVPREEAAPVLARFAGAGRRFERRGEAAGVAVIDDYAHHPTEVAATVAAARDAGFARVLVLFQPHLYSRTLHLAHEFGQALAAADAVAVADVYRAREQPIPGVTGRLVVDATSEAHPGMPLAWTPACADGARWLAAQARAGDALLTLGAGDVDAAGAVALEELRRGAVPARGGDLSGPARSGGAGEPAS